MYANVNKLSSSSKSFFQSVLLKINTLNHFYVFIPILLLMLLPSSKGQDLIVNEQIMKAYELRQMNKKDEAKSVLSEILKKDQTNAMAYFELYRLDPENGLENLEKTVELSPTNTYYKFELANAYMLKAYIAMQMGKEEDVEQPLKKCETTLKEVLIVKPDCKESLMFLIDLYSAFEDLGSKAEAEKLYHKLEIIDPLYAAQAKYNLYESENDPGEYWDNVLAINGEKADFLEKYGMACLNMGNIEKAKELFAKVMMKDNNKKTLNLQIARAHLYKAMRADDESRKKEIVEIQKYINLYLNDEEAKAKSIEAWCYGWLGMLEMREGDPEKGKILLEKAKQIYPEFSRATALPSTDKDLPPGSEKYVYKSYFMPF